MIRNVCDTLIDEIEIIGIGPLLSDQSQQLTANYWFMLHCKGNSIKVDSGYYDKTAGMDNHPFLRKFRSDYEATVEWFKKFADYRG